jgi:predicted transcriptional regulator
MTTAVTEITNEDAPPEALLTHLYGLTELDRSIFVELVELGERLPIDALAERVGRDRSTVYRAVNRLRDVDLVTRSRETIEGGGFRHVVQARDPEAVATDMEHTLNALYATFMPLTSEFEDLYADDVPEADARQAVAD